MSKNIEDVEQQVTFLEEAGRDFMKGLKIAGVFVSFFALACVFV